MIETKGKRILIDPGNIGYKDEYFDEWNNVDVILVTHKHGDHCHKEILKELDVKIYSTKEVADSATELNIDIAKLGDTIHIGNVKVEVVDAQHGYLPVMKGRYPKEAVGYIIDDGNKRLYHTGDTICFENDYKADILLIGVSGRVTTTAFEASEFAKAVGAEIVIPIHMESPKHPVNAKDIEETFERENINYKALSTGEVYEA
jgi:L-ascorbate metabolism protein UlaG (beta-lactamase superfamily)